MMKINSQIFLYNNKKLYEYKSFGLSQEDSYNLFL